MTIEMTCPTCGSHDISKNGTSHRGKQNYKCRDCGRQFVEDPQWQPKPKETKALNQEGIISLTNAGEIQFITPQAKELLNQYFPPYTPSTLPSPLHQWFQHQLTQLNTSSDLLFCIPLHVEQSERQLTICLIPNLAKSQNILILEEHQSQSFSIETLELLGLTKREAEVLFWVSKDKKNIAIANELHCSKGTIRKHLENIYKKLSVQTRMGAVMTALERLGLLNE